MPPAPHATKPAGVYTPLKIALSYLGGTYLLFLLIGRAAEAPDRTLLTLFIGATLTSFAVGYSLQAQRLTGPLTATKPPPTGRPPKKLISVAAAYYLLLGLTYLQVAGISDASALIEAFTNPGAAYYARLHRETQRSAAMQVLTLLGVLYPLLVPLAVTHWAKLTLAPRLTIVAGIGTYMAYYAAIGTMKGFGDILIFWGASYLVTTRAARVGTIATRPDRRRQILTMVVFTAFLSYMAFNMHDRLQHRDQVGMFPPNPIVAAAVGNDLASGLAATAHYPTHGYLGLAYNLQTPFVWTNGVGGSPAVGSYYRQYTGGDDQVRRRYTARTEMLSGWPDGMYWATVYPWLASDLTYPGAVLFMGVVGWFMARFWLEAVWRRRTLSMVLFCQLALLVAFVPANNQIGQNRLSLIAFLSVAALSVADRLRPARMWGAATFRSVPARLRILDQLRRR